MRELMDWAIDEESGQSMVEYGLIIGFITVLLINFIVAMDGSLQTTFHKVAENLLGQRP